MKKFTVWMLLSFLFVVSIYGQTDSLHYLNGFWLNSEKLSTSDVKEMMIENKDALKSYSSGRTMEVFGYVVGYPSAFIFGYDLGTRLGGGKGNNTVLLASGVGTAVGLILGLVAENHYRHSVTLYNTRFREEVSTLSFGLTETGNIGFMLRL